MREHPIPQDVTGYKFHLVGSMTLKQFAELVAGVLLALAVYKSNLPVFFKWPLLLSCVGIGFLVAFVPFEERPLDHWIVAFVQALYKPTKFFWKRESSVPDAFNYRPSKKRQQEEFHADLSPVRHKKIKEFIQSIDNTNQTYDQWEQENDQRVAGILSSFDEIDVPKQVSQSSNTKKQQKPDLKVRVRKLQSPHQETSVFDQTSPQPLFQSKPPSQSKPPAQSEPKTESKPEATSQPQNDTASPQPTNKTTDINKFKPAKTKQKPKPKAKSQDKQEIQEQPTQTSGRNYRTNFKRDSETNYNHSAEAATGNRNLPFPSVPSQPNKLVGMVITPQEEMINDAIVEISNEQGQIVRAVKTNSLGQFFVSTSLTDGVYFIDVDKEGYNFPTQKLKLVGKIVDPLEIRAETN
jgi:hypothetical protein